MDDQCPDSRSIEITAEHAVLIPALPTVKNVMAYVEAVAVVIGSCHIHSVFEAEENIKIYLNDKRFVDILVNNGVSILGRQMNVEYAMPRADKVIVSNVDPIVPDVALMKLLSFYGQPVSAVIHEKIATNCEYSHIECGKRRVYMKLFVDKMIPSHINFTFQENLYHVEVQVEKCDKNAACEPPTLVRNDEEANEEQLEVESNQSLKPNINELMPVSLKQPTPKQMAYRSRGKKGSPDFASSAARKIKRRARGSVWYNRITRIKRSKDLNSVKSSQAVRGRRLAVEKATNAIKKGKGTLDKKRPGRPSTKGISVQEISPEPFDVIEISGDESNAVEQSEPMDTQLVSQYPLSVEELQQFVSKTRFHREPMQVALEFLPENKNQDTLLALQAQLQEYHNACKEQSLKFRIKRLITVLKNAKEEDE